KGAVRAVDAGVDELHTVVSASESHNLANVNMTVAESLIKLRAVAEVAQRAKVPVVSGISCSFGCPFEGEVPPSRREWVVSRLRGKRVYRGPRALPARHGRQDGDRPRCADRDVEARPGDRRPRAARADHQGGHLGPPLSAS